MSGIKNNTTSNPLPKAKANQLRQILDDALARRPVINLTIQVPAGADPETVAAVVRQALSDFYPPPPPGGE